MVSIYSCVCAGHVGAGKECPSVAELGFFSLRTALVLAYVHCSMRTLKNLRVVFMGVFTHI